jgi:hypothetical protein
MDDIRFGLWPARVVKREAGNCRETKEKFELRL